ncbi:MAG TPA: aminotransferase class V-fold PLP-dependent enzyme [Candidatus Dormibacteraeota bacterium]
MAAQVSFPALVGAGLEVPLAGGGSRRYVNLDAAASTSPLRAVVDSVLAVLPWYSSVHRGAGFPSQVSTRLYETARDQVHAFVGAQATDTVVLVRNTTDALNHLAAVLPLPPGGVILSTAVEHHANMLPWRRHCEVIALAPPPSPEALLDAVAGAFAQAPAGRPIAAVAITGASNVTGEVMPIAEVARIAHQHGALVVVDGAQLAPSGRSTWPPWAFDCLALSGHKMYAPFGAGALVAPKALLAQAAPFLAGGGAVDFVTLDDVLWTTPPDRLEAGSPNVVGAVALATACATLAEIGMDAVAAHEQRLLRRLQAGLLTIPGLHLHRLWEGDHVDRLGVATFTVAGFEHALLAAALSAEHAIGVRHGCFCAHPYITHLLGIDAREAEAIRDRLRAGDHARIPGALRASTCLGTSEDDVDALVEALTSLVADGPRLSYVRDVATGDFHVENDPRAYPTFAPLPPLTADDRGGGCGRF